MAERTVLIGERNGGGSTEAAGITVTPDCRLHLASLRHFDAAKTGTLLQDLLGASLPAPRLACRAGTLVLAWRNPTETWVLSPDGGLIDALRERLGAAGDACVVDQTGGFVALRITGGRRRELLVRLASVASLPQPGQALAGRWAEVTAVAIEIAPNETLLLVERVYFDHVNAWILAALQDLHE